VRAVKEYETIEAPRKIPGRFRVFVAGKLDRAAIERGRRTSTGPNCSFRAVFGANAAQLKTQGKAVQEATTGIEPV
jgi:hypothetical protein